MSPTLTDHVKRSLLRSAGDFRRIGVAVSGGADSVCLFLVLRELTDVSILHFNHGLRGHESDADEAFVGDLAARFQVPFHTKRVDLQNLAGNLEQVARHARYQFFRDIIALAKLDCVATGHTLSDQAETVLFRLMRGSHLAGLAAIHPIAPGLILRPLLEVRREEVESYLRDASQPWREDSSNRDLRFDRNRIRVTLLPELKRAWNPELERSLGQLAALAFDEEQFWADYISQRAQEQLIFRGNIVLARASKLTEQPVAVARRLVRRAIEHVKGNLHAIDFAHVEAILNLARREEGDGRLQAPQLDIFRSFDWLRFAPLAEGDRLLARNQQCVCAVPGRVELPAADITVDLEVIENVNDPPSPEGPVESARVREDRLDWDRVLAFANELHLRTWKPGDQYRRATAESPCKVKTMFQEGRIPLWERGTWPIITVASQIIWSREFGPAAEVAAHPNTRRVLQIRDWRGSGIQNESQARPTASV